MSLNTVFTASNGKDLIYIKADTVLMHQLCDIFHDYGYKLEKSTYEEWDYNIVNGKSYSIESEKELNQFIKNNTNE